MRRRIKTAALLTLFMVSGTLNADILRAASQEDIEKAIKALDTIVKEEKSAVMNELIGYGSDAVGPLLAVAKDKDEITSLRSKCIYALGEIKDNSTVEDLLSLLTNEESPSRVRNESARALGKIGHKSAVPVLIKLLNDKDDALRFYSLVALGRAGNAELAFHVSDVLANDTNEKVRAEAIRILDEWDAKSESSCVAYSLSDSDPYIRGYAAQLCGIWKVKNAFPKVIHMLKYDNNDIVKISTAIALGEYNNMEAVPVLIDALDDMNTNVRISSADSLKKISGKDFGYDAAQWQSWYNENKST